MSRDMQPRLSGRLGDWTGAVTAEPESQLAEAAQVQEEGTTVAVVVDADTAPKLRAGGRRKLTSVAPERQAAHFDTAARCVGHIKPSTLKPKTLKAKPEAPFFLNPKT